MLRNSGSICLKGLYDFVISENNYIGLQGSSSVGREYGKSVTLLTNQISDNAGFYLWGRFNKKKFWHNIYIGKAGFKKSTGLRSRIKEELKDERPFIWRTIYNETFLEQCCEELYPNKYKDYIKQWKRCYYKLNSTYIIWVPVSDSYNDTEILKIEADLIETMNPTGNLMRPNPQIDNLIQGSISIIENFKIEINKIRNSNNEPIYIRKFLE